LEQGAPSRLREVEPLKREPLQCSQRGSFVDCAFQKFLDTDDRDDKRATAQGWQKRARRTDFAAAVSRSRSIR
jgi:hypothetical protein